MDYFENIDAMEEALIEILGIHQFCEALTRALSYDTKKEIYEYILRVYDIE